MSVKLATIRRRAYSDVVTRPTHARSSRFRTTVCAVVLVLIGGTATAQSADPFEHLNPAEAAELLGALESAAQAETDERWADAVANYDRAFALVPLEEYRFRAARCLEELEAYDDALVIYRELAASTRPDVSDSATERIAAIEQHLANRPAQLHVVTDPAGALVSVDEGPPVTTDASGARFETPPGDHTVRVELDGYATYEEPLALAAGEERELVLELERIDGPTRRNWTAPIVLGSLAVAAGGTALAFGILSDSRAEDERQYDRLDPSNRRARADELGDDADRFATIANIGYGVAGAAAVAAVILVFTGRTDSADSGHVSAHPSLLPSGAGGVLTIDF